MVSLEDSASKIYIYNLITKASDSMLDIGGKSVVKQADNRDTFCSTIAAFVEK